jgi:hypothetical protein
VLFISIKGIVILNAPRVSPGDTFEWQDKHSSFALIGTIAVL